MHELFRECRDFRDIDLAAKDHHIDAVRDAYDRPLSDELKKAGCLAYDCYRHLNRQNVFIAIGRWRSLEHFQQHLNQNKGQIQQIDELLTSPAELQILKQDRHAS